MMSSCDEVVLPCVPFYLYLPKFSRSAHRLATGRKFFHRALPCAAIHEDVVMLTLWEARQNRDPALTFLDAGGRPRAILDDREPVAELMG